TVPRNPKRVAMDLEAATVKLTDLASCGGCAAKYSAARLEQLLAGFVPVEAENLLVGLSPADDAAVYLLDDERALIFTLDFFPPVVDDPGAYGAIAATNALNDVFAMGGTPLLALSIAAFPEELPMEMLAEIFAAAGAQWGPDPARVGALPRDRRRTRRRPPRNHHERRPAEPRLRRAARRAGRRARHAGRARLRPADGRRPARLATARAGSGAGGRVRG